MADLRFAPARHSISGTRLPTIRQALQIRWRRVGRSPHKRRFGSRTRQTMLTSSPGALRADLDWFGSVVANRKGSYLPDRYDPIVFLHSNGSGASADNSPWSAADASPVTLVSDGKRLE